MLNGFKMVLEPMVKMKLEKNNINYVSVRGDYQEGYQKSEELVDKLIKK